MAINHIIIFEQPSSSQHRTDQHLRSHQFLMMHPLTFHQTWFQWKYYKNIGNSSSVVQKWIQYHQWVEMVLSIRSKFFVFNFFMNWFHEFLLELTVKLMNSASTSYSVVVPHASSPCSTTNNPPCSDSLQAEETSPSPEPTNASWYGFQNIFYI